MCVRACLVLLFMSERVYTVYAFVCLLLCLTCAEKTHAYSVCSDVEDGRWATT